MRTVGVLLAAALVLVGLIFVCVTVEAPAIEADLAARTSAAFAEASMPLDSVSFDGRDLALGGELAQESWRAEARAVALGVEGIRIVSFEGDSGVSQAAGDLLADRASDQATANTPLPQTTAAVPDGEGDRIDGQSPIEASEARDESRQERSDPAVGSEDLDTDPRVGADPEPAAEAPPVDTFAAAESSRTAETVRGESFQESPASARESEFERRITRFLRGKRIEFQNTKAELIASSREVLRELAPLLSEYPDVPLRIEGYTDSRGRPEANLDLSRRRAEAVRTYLISRGIAADRLTAIGRGPADPIADNGTPAGRRANRRIEFHIQDR